MEYFSETLPMLKVGPLGPRTCRWRTVHTTVHNQQALIQTANIVVIGTNTTVTSFEQEQPTNFDYSLGNQHGRISHNVVCHSTILVD